MATGGANDIRYRLLRFLPSGWFPHDAAFLKALTSGFASALSSIYGQITYATTQARLLTVSDGFLDLAAFDYRGSGLVRRVGESDAAFRDRLLPIFRPAVTRAALIERLEALTGNVPAVFEPSRPADTGGYGMAMGYGAAGRYGSLALPNQCFVTIARPTGQGIAYVAGYGSPGGGYGVGAIEYASLAMVETQVTDQDIYAEITNTIPVGCTAWTALTGTPIGGVTTFANFAIGVNALG